MIANFLKLAGGTYVYNKARSQRSFLMAPPGD